MAMEIEHFSHEHPLILSQIKDDDGVSCQICKKALSGSIYGCIGCEFYIHKSCSEFPREIQHFFHPCCLVLQKFPYSLEVHVTCEACHKYDISSFAYYCKLCRFCLDIECALQPPKTSEGDISIQHFSHWHPLRLGEINTESDEVICNACREPCRCPTYRCQECLFFLHKLCLDNLPQVLRHFFHQCPLILRNTSHYTCQACNGWGRGLVFHCAKCGFLLDLECFLLPTAKSDSDHGKIQHFLHEHPLELCLKDNSHGVSCFVCEESCLGSAYCCSKCKFYLHRSCAELQQVIKHPFHQQHSLTLGPGTSFCKACCRRSSCPRYHCRTCDFDLHVQCASLKPSLKYKDHDHLLTFVELMGGQSTCGVCNSTFSGTSYFRCVECDYNAHLLCIPLPQKIKHYCHIHPLTLQDYVIEDDSGEYYCDAYYCEQERDPSECVYHCEECKFITHVNCVISEILPILMDHHEDVELRRVDRAIALREVMKVGKIFLGDFLTSLTEREHKELTRAYSMWHHSHGRGILLRLKVKLENVNSILMFDSYDEHNLLNFLGENELFSEQPLNPLERYWDPDSEIINVGEHKITRKLVPTLKDLISKYGDFTAKCVLSSRLKLVALVGLVEVIHTMATIEVSEVTRRQLYEWWYCFKHVQLLGFDVQFAFQHLNKVAYARFVVEHQLIVAPNLKENHEKIIQCCTKIKERTKELEELKAKQRKYILSTRFAGSNISEENLTEALELRLNNAAMGLLRRDEHPAVRVYVTDPHDI